MCTDAPLRPGRPRRGLARWDAVLSLLIVTVVFSAGILPSAIRGPAPATASVVATRSLRRPKPSTAGSGGPAADVAVPPRGTGLTWSSDGNPIISGLSAPLGVAYDPRNGNLYVSSGAGGSVMVVNATTGAYIATIANPGAGVVGQILPVTFDPLNGLIYVSNTGTWGSFGDSLTVINGTTNTVVGTVPTGLGPAGVAVDTRNGTLYVADSYTYQAALGWSYLTLINGTTNQPEGTVNTTWGCAGPWALAYDDRNGYVYVAQSWNGGLCWFDTNTSRLVGFIGENATTPQMSWMTLDPADGYVYAVTQGHPVGGYSDMDPQSELYIFDTSTNTLLSRQGLPITMGNLSGGNSPGIGYDPRTEEVLVFGENFAALPGTQAHLRSTVLVFNGTSQVGTFYAGDPSWTTPNSILSSFAYDPSSGAGYITNWYDNSLSLVAPDMPLAPAVSPPAAVLVSNSNQTFSASTACLDGPCAASPVWSLNNTLGTLNATKGPIVRFTAGAAAGHTLISSKVALNGYNQSTGTPVWVHPPLSVTLLPNQPGTDVGFAVTLATGISGGSGAPYTFAYAESSGTAGCAPSNSYQIRCAPTAVGSFSVTVNVTDSTGERSVGASPTIAVGPELFVRLNVSSASPLLGQTVAFVANVTGGSPPYSYAYTGFPPGCVSIDVPAVGCLPTQSGYYNVSVQATDANAVSVSANVTVHVIFDFNVVVPTNTSVNSPFTISVNTNATFTPTALGLSVQAGFGVFTYAYSGLPPGCVSQDAPSLTCTPTQVGAYMITVSVHDQVGDHNTHTVVVNVVAASSGLASLFGADVYLILGGVAVVAAAVAVVSLLRSRRRKRGSGPPQGPELES